MLTHGAVASRYLGQELVDAVVRDHNFVQLRAGISEILSVLERLTLEPQALIAQDMGDVLEAGVSPAGIEQAVLAAGFMFNYQNRMADAMGADIPRDKLDQVARMLDLAGRRHLRNYRSQGEMRAYAGEIPTEVKSLYKSICFGDGDSPSHLRRSIVGGAMRSLGLSVETSRMPDSLVPYVASVIQDATKVTDEHIRELLALGWSEEEVFEVTVAASFGAAYGRLLIAWRRLEETRRRSAE
jgi:alkylhydroperoxidase family enzyme